MVKNKESVGIGDGPIDASFKAIDNCVGGKYKLTQFLIQATTVGSNAMAKVHVAVQHNGKEFYGTGINTDTIVAATLAYIDALNKFI